VSARGTRLGARRLSGTHTTRLLLTAPAAVNICPRGLNEHSNFERFWTAALTLFKIATNDNWTDIMTACLIGVSARLLLPGGLGCCTAVCWPGCLQLPDGCCHTTTTAAPSLAAAARL
jgi:hypothetical protein